MSIFEEKLTEIAKIINNELSYTEALNLISKLNTTLLPLPDDGEVDKNEMAQNRLNRMEIVINETHLLSDETKKEIIDLIKELKN